MASNWSLEANLTLQSTDPIADRAKNKQNKIIFPIDPIDGMRKVAIVQSTQLSFAPGKIIINHQ